MGLKRTGKAEPYHVSFRIRRVYFDQIVAGTKDREVRRGDFSDGGMRWRKIAAKAQDEIASGRPVEAVFVCGKDVHRLAVWAVDEYADPRVGLGREPSEQGKRDLGDGPVFAFSLGPKWW